MEVLRRLRQSFIPTSDALLKVAQQNLLKTDLQNDFSIAPHISTTDGLNVVVIEKIRIEEKSKSEAVRRKTLVLMHGYGSGLGFFYKNYAKLLGTYDRIVAVDWPGMGGSKRDTGALDNSRIPLTSLAYTAFTGNRTSIDEVIVPRTISYFTDSLNRALAELGMEGDQFHLAGHSLGGYLVTEYARKYDENVEALVLISPAGIPKVPKEAEFDQQKPESFGSTLRLAKLFWEFNGTPQQLVRHAGDWGKGMIKNSLRRRFNGAWKDDELDHVAEYLYHITAMPASGEYCLNALLQPIAYFAAPRGSDQPMDMTAPPGRGVAKAGIYARKPLEDSMKHHPFAKSKKPILILYGDHDWLRFETVNEVMAKWKEIFGLNVQYHVIKSAGHHLYLDNQDSFHATIDTWERSVAPTS